MDDARERIRSSLAGIESEDRVRVLLAVESGSRAWGFASADSDYDVRFLYVHEPEWYLSIETRRDVIERPIEEALDVSGWDLPKALRHFRKSNPPLLEWLQCPLIYVECSSCAARMRACLPEYFSPGASFRHYFHMARNNQRGYLRGDIVWRKKYLYVLRPLLAMCWIEAGRGAVPIEFQRLLDAALPEGEVRTAIEALLGAKRSGAELDRAPADPVLQDYIDREMARLETSPHVARPARVPPVAALDSLFREVLQEVWGPGLLTDSVPAEPVRVE